MTNLTFGERFLARSQSFGTLCVGMDPHPPLLEAWGLEVSAAGLEEFTRRCVEAFADTACVVKPQVAFYEAFGSRGYAILEEAIVALRQSGVLVIADAKRGDIGSTMAGYARAWLDPDSPLSVDAVTVSPYLGFDSLEPALELGETHNKGVIVLAATSNPEARGLQDSRFGAPAPAGAVTIAQTIVDAAAARNERRGDAAGNIGVVIGATLQDPPRFEHINGVVLMPGVGAQGATMSDVARLAGDAVRYVSPNVSRGILKAGPEVSDLREAVAQWGRRE